MKPKADTVRTSIDLPVELHRRLKELAARKGCSARKLIVESVEKAVVIEVLAPPRPRLDLRANPLVSVGGPPIDLTPEEIDDLAFS
jgi:hypothetical protein